MLMSIGDQPLHTLVLQLRALPAETAAYSPLAFGTAACVCHALYGVCHVEGKMWKTNKIHSRSERRKVCRLEPAPQVREQRRWQRKGKRAKARHEPYLRSTTLRLVCLSSFRRGVDDGE